MQRILYMDVSVLEDAALYEAWLPFLSVERQKKVAALKNPAAARLSCGAEILLYFALKSCGCTEQLHRIKKAPYGKPYIESLCFSLSHSGKYALCAYSDTNIGADLQRMKPAIPKQTKRILSPEEEFFLSQTAEQERAALFYRLWARKESLIKWDGRGLRIPLAQLSFMQGQSLSNTVELDSKKLYVREYPKMLVGYAVCLCNESGIFPEKAEDLTQEILKMP